MVLGRIDTGKSTFCRQLAFCAKAKGLKVAIIDSDIGQSWIGPPTTVAMKIYNNESDMTLFPDDFYFVGSVTPERHLIQTVVGAKRMVESAELANADLIIIDTTGLVDRPIGRALKQSKIDLIKPDQIVCFQRERELESLIGGSELDFCQIHRLVPSKYAERKSQDYRYRYRNQQFAQYFSDDVVYAFPFSQLKGQRDCFLNGSKATSKELENISTILDTEVIYAEFFCRGLFLITTRELSWTEKQKLCSQLKIDDLTVRVCDCYKNMLVALINSKGDSLCLGLIEFIDFNNYILSIKCKKEIAESAKVIQFSDFRIDNI
jgi:polynucleotide 5'-hydroxyl-kinase GRC3/NOL9